MKESDMKNNFVSFICQVEQAALRFLKLFIGFSREHEIDWKKCIGIGTDGAANMTGHLSGIVAKMKNVGHPDILFTQCITHREQTAKKKVAKLHEVLSNVIEIIKEIRHKALHSGIFEPRCEEMSSKYSLRR
ncbi:uncharacterized protein TNCV_1293341 [Trichonephila clavipes]|nr:uncharacterized protein TNCV_1293341 [Trichonephila clavipes]